MRVRSLEPFGIFLALCVLGIFPLTALGQASQAAFISAEARFDNSLLDSVKIRLSCNPAGPQKQEFELHDGEKLELPVVMSDTSTTNCQVLGELPDGYSVTYSVEGPSAYKADEGGCKFTRIIAGQSNNCRIEVVQDPVNLTVYKKWIGASGEEADIRITLSCESGSYSGDRYINQGFPDGWEINNIDPNGLLCNVSETVRDSFRPDILDCQGLLIIPGRDEECTMVNTKIVKRIEMFNRFGKIVMVVLILTIGLVAAKRLA